MTMAPLIENLPMQRSHGVCRRCGGAIPSSRRRDAIYCSNECRQQTNRENWKWRNPDGNRLAQRRYYDANRKACNQRVADYYANLDKLAEKRDAERRWRAENRGHVNAQARERRRRERSADPESAYLKKKRQHLWSLYRLTLEDYDEMLAAQTGRCAICHALPEARFDFHVDHRHKNGHIRGLLCRLCNPMLGMARENPETLRAAIAYLERSAA